MSVFRDVWIWEIWVMNCGYSQALVDMHGKGGCLLYTCDLATG